MESESSTTFSAVHDVIALPPRNMEAITLRQFVVMALVCAVIISDIVIAYAILEAEGVTLQRISRVFSSEWWNR